MRFTFAPIAVAKAQPRVAPAQRAVWSVAGKVEKDFQTYLLKALEGLKGQVDVSEIARLVSVASEEEVYRALNLQGIEAITTQLSEDMSGGVVSGGKSVARELPRVKVPVIDLGRPAVSRWLNDHAAELVKGISDQSKEAVSAMIRDGVMRGRHPTRLARDIEQAVGLTERQAGAVIRRRAMLEKQGVSQERIDKLSDAYSKKLLKHRAQVIAHTESMTAVNHGRDQMLKQLQEDGALPKDQQQEWLTSEDEMVCESCGPLNGVKQPIGASWSSGGFTVTAPPLHPQCLPEGTMIDGPMPLAATRRGYSGELVELQTASGASLSITPNHPIFTPNGWVAAKLLSKGSDIISSGFSERMAWSPGPTTLMRGRFGHSPDRDYMPSSIEKIFDSLRFSESMLSTEVPSSEMQFHGDGTVDGKVEVIYPDGFLGDNFEPARLEPSEHQAFTSCHIPELLHRLGSSLLFSDSKVPSPRGMMRRFRQLQAIFFASLLHSYEHRLASIAWSDPASQQATTNNNAGHSKLSGQSKLGFTSKISPADFINRKINLGLLHRDRITSVRMRGFCGHVYNLQTLEGWYLSNGIVSSNCRCTTALV